MINPTDTGILFGFMAALCWGVADFCARGAARSAGIFRTLLAIEILGFLALLALGLPTGLVRLANLPAGPLWLAIALNLIILAGAALLYRAFAIGTIAIVSPIAASYAAITALLALFSGERPGAAHLLGITITLGGVFLVSTVPGHPSASTSKRLRIGRLSVAPGLIEALSAMLVFGIGYWGLRYVVGPLGGVTTAFVGKAVDLVALIGIGLAVSVFARYEPPKPTVGETRTHPRSAPTRATSLIPAVFLLYVIPNALLDTAANVAYNIGITTALTSIVSVISSLFSAVTVLLAWIFLHERLTRWQALGAGAILLGVALVST